MRKCGDCRECCIALAIDELDKPPGTPCKNLCASGCGIYVDRPNECRQFICAWLQGLMPLNMKPNKIHAVMWGGSLGDTPVLRISRNPNHKLDKRVKRWMARRQVILSTGESHELMRFGVSVDKWKSGQQLRVDVKGGVVAQVTPV